MVLAMEYAVVVLAAALVLSVGYNAYCRERERRQTEETMKILAARTLGEYANAKKRILEAGKVSEGFDPGFGS